MSDYDHLDPYDDWPDDDPASTTRRQTAPAGGRVLWGRVAFYGVTLLLAFLLGRFTAPSDDAETVADLESDKADLEARIEQLEAEIEALEAGGVNDDGAAAPEAEAVSDDDADDVADEGGASDDDAGTPTDEEASPSPDEGTVHVVRDGEHLFGIAEAHYGDGERWRDIAEANGLSSEDVLIEGTELIIPPP